MFLIASLLLPTPRAHEKVLVASCVNSNLILILVLVSNSCLFLVVRPGAPSSVLANAGLDLAFHVGKDKMRFQRWRRVSPQIGYVPNFDDTLVLKIMYPVRPHCFACEQGSGLPMPVVKISWPS